MGNDRVDIDQAFFSSHLHQTPVNRDSEILQEYMRISIFVQFKTLK